MARTSRVHYISPSVINITPNANGTYNDIAVSVAKGAKIKVWCKSISGLDIDENTNSYREWKFTGRNRRLADSTKPYTIYVRMEKFDYNKAYLVFAPKNMIGGVWVDKYEYITPTGLASIEGSTYHSGYWDVRIGDVTLPENGKRKITFDT